LHVRGGSGPADVTRHAVAFRPAMSALCCLGARFGRASIPCGTFASAIRWVPESPRRAASTLRGGGYG
jgi:hypothetical protein